MPLTIQQAQEIATYGKYYRQDVTRSGNPTRNVFCDYCGRSGLTGSWKINNETDLCTNCYTTLQHSISLANTKFNKPNNNLDNRLFSPYDAMKSRQNERFDFTDVSQQSQPIAINGVPYAHNFPSINMPNNMTNERLASTNQPTSDYGAMFGLPLDS
jgi:hypothetical protein